MVSIVTQIDFDREELECPSAEELAADCAPPLPAEGIATPCTREPIIVGAFVDRVAEACLPTPRETEATVPIVLPVVTTSPRLAPPSKHPRSIPLRFATS